MTEAERTATPITSMASLFKAAFNGTDLNPLRYSLVQRLQSDESDAGAWIDLSIVEQLLGNTAAGLRCQSQGLGLQRLYRSSWPASPGALRVLAFMLDGEINTNMPIDFLLQDNDIVLYSLYLVAGSPIPDNLPDHDISIVAISESHQALSTLQHIERHLLPAWPRPVLNHPSRIALTSREQMYQLLADVPGVFMPPTLRLARPALQALAQFPLIARPIGSHAGTGLAKLPDAAAVQPYLAEQDEQEFFVSPFVDYRSPDSFFRKYRVMWVDGRAYPVHMAVAEDWKVWYLNAGMDASEWKRAEEAQFLSAFSSGFGRRHATALRQIADRFRLDYFGIDCGEMPDGRLLVFEGSIALAAHDMDPPALYPYKSPQMRRLFAAFYEMLFRKSQAPSQVVACL